jgi:hypothetical protein
MKQLHLFKFILFALVSSLGCGQTNRETPYDEILNRIPVEFHKFFPLSISCDSVFMNFNELPYINDYEAKPTYYYITYSSDNLDSLVSITEPIALGKYSFSDSCNIIVYKFQNKKSYNSPKGREWLYEKWIKRMDNCSGHFPIPNFLGLDSTDFIPGIGLSKDYSIYVINVDSNRIFDSRFYGSDDIMPTKWRTGHSSGICISKEKGKAISWLVIW